MRGYLPLIQKDSSTHMHGLTVHVKEGLPFEWEVFLENSADSYVFDWFTSCSIFCGKNPKINTSSRSTKFKDILLRNISQNYHKDFSNQHENSCKFCYEKGSPIWIIFFNWDSLHARQNLATVRHGVTRKRTTKKLKPVGNLFWKNLKLKGVCWF